MLKMWDNIKKVLGAIGLFIAGFFLIRRVTDFHKEVLLGSEKAKNDSFEKDSQGELELKKNEINRRFDKALDNLEEEKNKNIADLEQKTAQQQTNLDKKAQEDPDSFAQEFADRFGITYTKR